MPALPMAKFVPAIVKVYSGHRYSPATLGRVCMVLRQFGALGATSTSDLSTAFMTDYTDWLYREVTENHNTINGYLSSAASICAYAVEEGWLDKRPNWRRVRLPETPMVKNLPPTFSQAVELLGHLAAKTDWVGRRLCAFTWLTIHIGPRLREVTYAHDSDLDEAAENFTVNPLRNPRKRNKTIGSARVVPLPPPCAAMMRAWRPLAGPVYLFPGVKRRGPWDGGPSSSRPLGQLQAAALEVGIKHITVHSLRHAFGTYALEVHNLPTWVVQQMMGHSSLRTTEKYLHLKGSPKIRDAVQGVSFAPLP